MLGSLLASIPSHNVYIRYILSYWLNTYTDGVDKIMFLHHVTTHACLDQVGSPGLSAKSECPMHSCKCTTFINYSVEAPVCMCSVMAVYCSKHYLPRKKTPEVFCI